MKAPSVTDGNATTTGDQAAIIDTDYTGRPEDDGEQPSNGFRIQ
jgi:hypothetical protein